MMEALYMKIRLQGNQIGLAYFPRLEHDVIHTVLRHPCYKQTKLNYVN